MNRTPTPEQATHALRRLLRDHAPPAPECPHCRGLRAELRRARLLGMAAVWLGVAGVAVGIWRLVR